MSPIVIGLTGPIGAGKSTVAALLRKRGAKVLDADLIARDEQIPGSLGHLAIVEQFGQDVLAPDGEINRAKLAAIVFADPERLKRLEAILHPRVAARVAEAKARLEPGEVLVVEAIKLLGGHVERLCDRIWVVVAPRAVLAQRLRSSRAMSELDIDARLAAQPSEEVFRARAAVVFENLGDEAALERAVDREWRALAQRA